MCRSDSTRIAGARSDIPLTTVRCHPPIWAASYLLPMRSLRRLVRRLTRSRVPVVYHPEYAQALPGVPLDANRGERILAFLDDEGLLAPRDMARPQPASMEALLRVHSAEYLETLDRVETATHVFGVQVTDAQRQRALELQRLAAGGTIQTLRMARRSRRCVVNLGGGLHHATPSAGMAFCLLNDVAVGIAHLRHYGFDAPILVVDLDLHDGNGTRAAFAGDPSVHTLSIHNQDWEPFAAVASTSVALGTGVDDETYLEAIRQTLPPVVNSHEPGFVVYVAGTDPAADDRMGDWQISEAGMFARDRFVIETVRQRLGNVPIGIVLAGGYGRRTWRYTARFIAWIAGNEVLDPPDELELTLRRFRARAVRPFQDEDDGWGLTEDDLFSVAPGQTKSGRVLGVFSKHAIELSLERAGFLEELVRRGYECPTVGIQAGSGLGETIRVYGDAERTELLMEVRLNRSTRVIPPMEVLYVEWLLLQHPRAVFTKANPQLPGQDHPGLGLLREVVAWLVVLCETIGLDGVASVPAQYYMAVLSRHQMRFVDPEARARFEALHATLRDLSLVDASRALEEGRVLDDATGDVVQWEGAVQIYPVSDRLRELVEQAAMAPSVSRYRFRVAPT